MIKKDSTLWILIALLVAVVLLFSGIRTYYPEKEICKERNHKRAVPRDGKGTDGVK